jgi:hypothetical protein
MNWEKRHICHGTHAGTIATKTLSSMVFGACATIVPHTCCIQCRTNAIEELRNQVGTFRFDLKNLASSKGDKAARKAGLVKAKALIQEAEQLDLALRKKDKSKAKDIYKSVLGLLNDFDSSL